jgi:hypothetical protein
MTVHNAKTAPANFVSVVLYFYYLFRGEEQMPKDQHCECEERFRNAYPHFLTTHPIIHVLPSLHPLLFPSSYLST